MCVSLVDQASEKKKIAATDSGILPALKAILDDPPPPKSSGFSPIGEKSTQNATSLPNDPTTIILPSTQSVLASSELAEISENDPTKNPAEFELQNGGDQEATEIAPSEQQPSSSEKPDSQATIVATVPAESETPKISTLSTSHSTAETSRPLKVAKVKGVSFDLVDHVIVDTKSHPPTYDALALNDASDLMAGSPHSIHNPVLPDDCMSSEALDASAEVDTLVEAKNKEDIYYQACVSIDHIIKDISKDALDLVGEAYAAVGIHESLIKLLEYV